MLTQVGVGVGHSNERLQQCVLDPTLTWKLQILRH